MNKIKKQSMFSIGDKLWAGGGIGTLLGVVGQMKSGIMRTDMVGRGIEIAGGGILAAVAAGLVVIAAAEDRPGKKINRWSFAGSVGMFSLYFLIDGPKARVVFLILLGAFVAAAAAFSLRKDQAVKAENGIAKIAKEVGKIKTALRWTAKQR